MSEIFFKRVEEKYLITKEQFDLLMDRIGGFLEKDKYYEATINNIYFDTKNDDLIIDSLEKPAYKQKIRLRSYGTPSLGDNVFLEIKDKYLGMVGKRRVELKLKDFYEYQEKKSLTNSSQIMKEIDYYFKYYDLKPVIYIGYDRKSYCGKKENRLRITIDSNLRSRREELHLELGDAGRKYFSDSIYIMEIKTLGSMPLWLTEALSDFKIYPISFSKYGEIYKKERGVFVC